MENTNILPNTLVPDDIRLQVYKKAVKLILTKDEILSYRWAYGLCLLLPCILWNLPDYECSSPNDLSWDWRDTKNMFPELTDDYLYAVKGTELNYGNSIRIDYLQGWISKLEKK